MSITIYHNPGCGTSRTMDVMPVDALARRPGGFCERFYEYDEFANLNGARINQRN